MFKDSIAEDSGRYQDVTEFTKMQIKGDTSQINKFKIINEIKGSFSK